MADKHLHNRVRFESDIVPHQSDYVTVEAGTDDSVNVQLGFLQSGHVYEIQLPPVLHKLGTNPTSDTRPKVKLVGSRRLDSNRDEFIFHLFAHPEGLLVMTSLLSSSDNTQTLLVRFHAKVIGKLMGTPILKNGIKSIAMQEPNEPPEELLD